MNSDAATMFTIDQSVLGALRQHSCSVRNVNKPNNIFTIFITISHFDTVLTETGVPFHKPVWNYDQYNQKSLVQFCFGSIASKTKRTEYNVIKLRETRGHDFYLQNCSVLSDFGIPSNSGAANIRIGRDDQVNALIFGLLIFSSRTIQKGKTFEVHAFQTGRS